MSQVYHDKEFNPIEVRERTFPDDFQLVAECETNDLERIFALTNHIDEEWWLNEGVKKQIPKPRSTSCGDVVVLDGGKVCMCSELGWKDIGHVYDVPLKFQTGFGIK